MTHILLTTYPAHKSQNSGDDLIARSALALMRSRWADYQPTLLFRETPLDGFTKRRRYRILAPGFSVANETYPRLFALFRDLSRMERFWPVGCSFQAPLPDERAFEDPYSVETLEFLKMIADRFGAFPCRDALIVRRLERFGIPAFYIGDLALFDENRIGEPMRWPETPRSFVITLQHHPRYLEQIVDLAKRMARSYPDWERYISMHVYGGAENFSLYENIDLHIGYRLHGHISFLRNRKPSILMIEDARSFGFSRTPGLEAGCIDAWSIAREEPDDEAPERAMAWLATQMTRRFVDYEGAFRFIDEVFATVVDPYFNKIAKAAQA